MNICKIVLAELCDENAENWKDITVFHVILRTSPWITPTQRDGLFENVMQNEDDYK